MICAPGTPLRLALAVTAAIAASAAAVPDTAQATGLPGQGLSKAPSVTAIGGMPAGRESARAPAPPQPGVSPAVATTGESSPAAVILYTGTDRHSYEVGLVSPPLVVDLGGGLSGGPGATFIPAGSLGPGIAIFGRGTDNALYRFTGNRWVSFGGGLTSRPGAAAGALAVSGGESLDVVARGSDGAVWDREFTSAAARPWVSLGGHVLAGTGPAAVNVDGTLYAFAVGTDQALWVEHSTDGAHWSGWRSLGGRVTGDVGAATPASGVGAAFARGADNSAWYNEFVGATTGATAGWHPLGGRLTSGVGAASRRNGSTWAVVLGADNNIWQATGPWPVLRWSKAF